MHTLKGYLKFGCFTYTLTIIDKDVIARNPNPCIRLTKMR
jgi:hypothetical protein